MKEDHPVKPWRAVAPLHQPKLLHSFDDQRANALAFEPGGRRLIAAYGNAVTAYGDVPTTLWEDVQFRKHLGVTADGRVLLDHTARRDTDTTAPQPELGPGYEIREGCQTLDGAFVALKLGWRPPRGRPVKGPDGKRSYQYARANKPGGPNEYFEVLDTVTAESVLRIDKRYTNFACSKQHIAVAMGETESGTQVVLVEPATRTSRTLDRGTDTPVGAGTVAFSAAGDILTTVSWKGEVSTWVAPNFRLLKTGKVGELEVDSVAVHPGGMLFIGLKDGRMMLVNPETLEVAHEWSVAEHADLDPFQRSSSSAAFSDDGTRLATAHGAVGSNVRVWQFAP